MADNKQNVGEPDRSRVSGSEDYELDHVAQKHGISRDQVRELVERFGNDREVIDREAAKLGRG